MSFLEKKAELITQPFYSFLVYFTINFFTAFSPLSVVTSTK